MLSGREAVNSLDLEVCGLGCTGGQGVGPGVRYMQLSPGAQLNGKWPEDILG